jgi:hypothetical protein|tara:strand:- start:2723 stop:2959 length:237 start_codon:yes stop_codon:yes gene_type:complete
VGERLKGYLNEFQKGQGYYLEEDEQSITLFKFSMGEQSEDGEKVTGGAYNPVPIAIVSKDADSDKDRLIKKLLLSATR